MNRLIGRHYQPHPSQLVFQKNKSTELAPAPCRSIETTRTWLIAILDLKAAYDSVPRKTLVERIRKVLDPETAESGSYNS